MRDHGQALSAPGRHTTTLHAPRGKPCQRPADGTYPAISHQQPPSAPKADSDPGS